MSDTNTNTDSSVVFVGEEITVQLHPEEQKKGKTLLVPKTPEEDSPSSTSGVDNVIPETQMPGNNNISLITTYIKYFKTY